MLHFCFSEKGPRVPHLHPDPLVVHGVWVGAPRGAPLSPGVLLCTWRLPPSPSPASAHQPTSSSDVLCHPSSCPQPPGSRHSLACQSSPLPAHTLSTPGYPHSQLPVILSPPETSHFRVGHTSLQRLTIQQERDVLVIILPLLPLVLFRVLCCGFCLPSSHLSALPTLWATAGPHCPSGILPADPRCSRRPGAGHTAKPPHLSPSAGLAQAQFVQHQSLFCALGKVPFQNVPPP